MAASPNLFDGKSKAKRQKAAPAPGGAVHALITLYCQLFGELFHGDQPVISPADGKALKGLVTQFGQEKVHQRVIRYMALDDAFIASQGYPLRLMPGVWNKLTALVHQQGAPDLATAKTNEYLRKLQR